MELVRYGLAVLIVIAMPPAITYWFLLHPFVGFWRRLGAKPTFTILAIFMIGSMTGLFFLRERLVGSDLGLNPWLIGVAAIFYLTSLWFYRQRRNLLKFTILAGGPELDASGRGGALITTGIYSRVRNPRYLEVGLAIIAYALVANYVGTYVVTGLTVLSFFPLVWVEERELEDRFGDEYRRYLETVPRFIPRFGFDDSSDSTAPS